MEGSVLWGLRGWELDCCILLDDVIAGIIVKNTGYKKAKKNKSYNKEDEPNICVFIHRPHSIPDQSQKD